MVEEFPETSKKRVFVLLFLLILLGGAAIYFAVNTTGTKSVLAVPNVTADMNQPHTERNRPNEPSLEPNRTSAGPNLAVVEPNQFTTEPNQPVGREVKELGDEEILRPLHKHPAYTERLVERGRMVDWQIESRSINDPNVLTAMRVVPRHFFVRPTEERYAYTDNPLPIGYGQTISQPYIVAFMTEALRLNRNSRVLEIGTGSGYQAAVCAEIAKAVYTIEIVDELAESAKKRLKELGYRNVFVKAGDGYYGWPEHAPFDAIIGTAAAGRVPDPLLKQLKPGGRMILPYGSPKSLQYLVLITKDKNGKISRTNVMPVRFVPMTGEVQKPEKEPK
jgi:protein-L-isoaspartate(D-aspartate) O-methyltransferase